MESISFSLVLEQGERHTYFQLPLTYRSDRITHTALLIRWIKGGQNCPTLLTRHKKNTQIFFTNFFFFSFRLKRCLVSRFFGFMHRYFMRTRNSFRRCCTRIQCLLWTVSNGLSLNAISCKRKTSSLKAFRYKTTNLLCLYSKLVLHSSGFSLSSLSSLYMMWSQNL